MKIDLAFADSGLHLAVRRMTGVERVGAPSRFELALESEDPVDFARVLDKTAALEIAGPQGARAIVGVVTGFTSIATSIVGTKRRYEVVLESGLATMELTERTRVFQHMTVPEILVKALVDGGMYPASAIVQHLGGKHAKREYVVQWRETDLDFVRRLAEDEGIFFTFGEDGGKETIVLADTSSSSPVAHGGALPIVDPGGFLPGARVATDLSARAARRPGKVTLRDYDHEKPALSLEGVASDGTGAERTVEVYRAPGGFKTPSDGAARAKLALEVLRADSLVASFRTTALDLAPGTIVDLEPDAGFHGIVASAGPHFVVALHHDFTADAGAYEAFVEATPKTIPYRSPRTTPRPQIDGAHSAIVTGAPGEEIHPDELGRIRVRFPWDREGPDDDKSSLPVRTMQPNTPGSMILPRVGWEVFVAFEDGDPDRPYVLGRTFNAAQPPNRSLPANKTMTCIATHSSPGGGGHNSIEMDDAAGRQHLSINAAFGKSTSVANDLKTQTAKNENIGVTGSQGRTVSANEDVSVAQAYLATVGSQTAMVGAAQKIFAKGNHTVQVGSETVMVGGALIEKIGNPVTGAKNLLSAAAMQGAGAMGVAGQVFSTVAPLGQAAVAGYQSGGASGALSALGGGALGMAAGMVPGGDAIMASVQGGGITAPWRDQAGPPGAQAAGGGATGGSDASSAAGPGPGHRDTEVKGAMTELVGARYAVATPGTIAWKTTGASTFLIGGSHNISTRNAGNKVLGAATELLGSLKITTTGAIARTIKGALNTTIAGGLKSTAGGKHTIDASTSLTFDVAGSLKLDGGTVKLEVGGSSVTIDGSGLVIEASTITINGKYAQSSKVVHT